MRGQVTSTLTAALAGALGALAVVALTGLWPVGPARAAGGSIAADRAATVGTSAATPTPAAAPTPTATPTATTSPTPTRSTPPPEPRTGTDAPVEPGRHARFASLTTHERQRIQPQEWTELRFHGEPSDRANWHRQGGALVVPDVTAVAQVCAKVTWVDDPRPEQYYLQIARDPRGRIDVTGAENTANTVGRQYRAHCWVMTVREGQPLAIRVKHDGPAATSVHFAEFKVWVP